MQKNKQMKGGHYICGFLDFLEAENFYYTLFEYCSEGELFAKVEIDEIDPKVCQILFHQMVLGLQVIHDAGIVHRDFSLENCFLQPIHSDEERKEHGGITQIIKIGDFGLAKFIPKNGFFPGEKGLTKPGKPLYMPPEIRRGLDYNGQASDIYSLGITLLVLLTRRNDQRFILDIARYGVEETLTHYGYHTLSIAAKNLLSRMLDQIPEKRITLVDILKHYYLATSPLQS